MKSLFYRSSSRHFLLGMAALLIVLCAYSWWRGQPEHYLLLIALSQWGVIHFRYASEDKQLNALQQRIVRTGDALEVRPEKKWGKSVGAPLCLPVEDLYKLNVSDGYLGIICGDNGRGYDLWLEAERPAILAHLKQILSPQELAMVGLESL